MLGDARVYLKVSVLVEAGEAVRHFAAFAPLRTKLSGSLLPSRDTRPLARLPSSPPPPTPTRRAQAGREETRSRVQKGAPPAQAPFGPGGGTLSPLHSRGPARPRRPRVRVRAREQQALPERKVTGAQCAWVRMFSTCSLLRVRYIFLPSCFHVCVEAHPQLYSLNSNVISWLKAQIWNQTSSFQILVCSED